MLLMSALKKLSNYSKKNTGCIIKAGIVVVLETQEQFNKLAFVSGGQFQEDSIIIDGIYLAQSDDIGAINVFPAIDLCEDMENIYEALSHRNLKDIDFDKWYKKIKGQIMNFLHFIAGVAFCYAFLSTFGFIGS